MNLFGICIDLCDFLIECEKFWFRLVELVFVKFIWV